MKNKVEVSEVDKLHLSLIRENVRRFMVKCAERYDREGRLLDIAPQVHEGASPFFKKATVETLDIDPNSGATYIADICRTNSNIIPDNTFDMIVCTEVLEHTLNPFDAVKELYRIVKRDGLVFVSTPFDFRIHGPLPDCWRFTEYGLRALFKQFTILEITGLANPNRDLMPIHYTLIAQK
ncbi:MAG: methyltransferase domain-containing protein [Nitrososphaerota archaeon]